MKEPVYLLIQSAGLLRPCRKALQKLSYEGQQLASIEEAQGRLHGPALLLVALPEVGLEGVSTLRQALPSVDLIVLGDEGSLEEATALIHEGVIDYLYRPLRQAKLTEALQRWELRRQSEGDPARLFQIIALMELGRTLTGTLQLDELYDQIIEQVKRAFRPDTVSLMLLSEQGDRLRLVVQRGLPASALPGTEVSLEEGIAGKVVREGEPQLLLGGLQGTVFEGLARHGSDIGSAMSVPLHTQGKIVGVLNVNRQQGRAPYTESDATLLHIFAAQIAIAVQNAQLYESLREERDRIIQAQEEVRKELARDLHDGLTQVLAALAVNIGHLRSLVGEGKLGQAEIQAELEFLRSIARQAIHDARTLIFGLRPLILETQGILVALEHYLAAVREGDRRTTYHLSHQGFQDPTLLAPNVARMLFAILQEAINNARKHARAERVQVHLQLVQQKGQRRTIHATVEDDGVGFNLGQVEGSYDQRYSFGLLNMKERAALIDAEFKIESRLQEGTRVIVRVPWREGEG